VLAGAGVSASSQLGDHFGYDHTYDAGMTDADVDFAFDTDIDLDMGPDHFEAGLVRPGVTGVAASQDTAHLRGRISGRGGSQPYPRRMAAWSVLEVVRPGR